MIRFLILAFLTFTINTRFVSAQTPRIKINYKVQRGTMKNFVVATNTIQLTGGACTEADKVEIRVHAQLRSNTGPASSATSYAATNTCPSGTCNTCTTGSSGWSCEQRCETPTNGGTCGTWVLNGSQNASYPGDPGYVDTSKYPSNDILEVQMKGFETDNFFSALNSDKVNFNYNDGSCQATCANGSCYGNYQIPTSGRYTTIDVGAIGNSTLPHNGTNWSSYIPVAYEGINCALDVSGNRSYYYLEYQYRWVWDSTTLNNSHAGLIKTPNTLIICSGSTAIINDSSEAYEAARGFSTYQWQYSTNGTTWIDIASATSKNLSTNALTNNTLAAITYQIRRVGLFCVDFKSAITYRKFPVYSNLQSIVVYPQPIAPTLFTATPTNNSTICKGTFTFAQVYAGTGGYIDANDELEYTINNGINWLPYVSGNSINTSTAIDNVKVRARRTGGSFTICGNTSWIELANWVVSPVATPPTLDVASPINNASICAGYYVSSTFNAGSGGTGDEFEFSINNGVSWNPYTPNNAISTGLATGSVIIRGRRTGTVSPCLPAPWVELAKWNIVTPPISPSLLTKTPNSSSVCTNGTVNITVNAGTGGVADAVDQYEISIDNETNWVSYLPGSSIALSTGDTKATIRSRRTAGTTFGCSSTTWTELASWTIDQIPTGTLATPIIYNCDATAELKVNNLFPSNAVVSWVKRAGDPGNPSNSNLNPLLVSSLTEGTTSRYSVTISNGICTATNLGFVDILLPIKNNLDISTNDVCQNCIISDGDTKTFYDETGKIIGKITDLNTPSSNLGETEMCMSLDPIQLSILDNNGIQQPYLKRKWTIDPQNNTSVEVTLYFTEAELSAMRTFCDGTDYEFVDYNGLYINKFVGGSNGTFSGPNSTLEETIIPTFSAHGSGHKLTFKTNNFSTIYLFPSSDPTGLPIELTKFYGNNLKNGIELNWETKSEVNVNRFELERSESNLNWETIYKKQVTENSFQTKNYTYFDINPVLGNNYYRLKTVDNDNTFEYSKIIMINRLQKKDLVVYPNPTNNLLFVNSKTTLNFYKEITITNLLGEIIYTKQLDNENSNTISLSLSKFPAGIYFISLFEKDGNKETLKINKY